MVHTTSAHIKKAYLQHWHTPKKKKRKSRHTKNYKHSNQSQILSYIRLDNKRNFLGATSTLSFVMHRLSHCHTH